MFLTSSICLRRLSFLLMWSRCCLSSSFIWSMFWFSAVCSSLFNSKLIISKYLSKSENLREDKLRVSLMIVLSTLISQTTFWVAFYFLNYRNVEFFKLAWSTNSPWYTHQIVTVVGTMAKCRTDWFKAFYTEISHNSGAL